MRDFFNIFADKLIEYHNALMEDTSNHNKEGYSLTDDNCYLFLSDQYYRFCAPFIEMLFKEFAPLTHHRRCQHSDSSMGHLMGILRDIGINEVNFGPDMSIQDIRKAMPTVLIYGQIAPFTLRNGTQEEVINAVKHDIEAAGWDGGLIECPAGSVAGGTPLENIKAYMWAVHEYGRY